MKGYLGKTKFLEKNYNDIMSWKDIFKLYLKPNTQILKQCCKYVV